MKKYLWFDFENAPHVWIFKELLSAFPEYEIIITVRNFSSTVGLCNYLKIPYEIVGKQLNKKSNIGKFIAVIIRAFLLKKYLNKKRNKTSFINFSRFPFSSSGVPYDGNQTNIS